MADTLRGARSHHLHTSTAGPRHDASTGPPATAAVRRRAAATTSRGTWLGRRWRAGTARGPGTSPRLDRSLSLSPSPCCCCARPRPPGTVVVVWSSQRHRCSFTSTLPHSMTLQHHPSTHASRRAAMGTAACACLQQAIGHLRAGRGHLGAQSLPRRREHALAPMSPLDYRGRSSSGSTSAAIMAELGICGWVFHI